jgi:hypothetical protein
MVRPCTSYRLASFDECAERAHCKRPDPPPTTGVGFLLMRTSTKPRPSSRGFLLPAAPPKRGKGHAFAITVVRFY